jgi:hypothetical protein
MPDSYSGYDIKQLFQMVDAARQDLAPSRKQHAALKRATEMLGEHAGALQGYRDQLAAKWPPETNAASAAYLVELDKLLKAVKDTAQTSAVNAFHVNLVAEAIVQAHNTLKPLHDEYVKNEGLLQQYDTKVAAVGADYESVGGAPTGAAARGLTRLFTSSPVDDGRQEELVRLARQAMAPLSVAAQDGGTYITPPPPYAPPTVDPGQIDGGTHIGRSSNDGAIRPPAIDPPAHARTSIRDGGEGDGPGSRHVPDPTGEEPSPPPRPNSGPVLSGVITPVAPVVPPSGPAVSPPGSSIPTPSPGPGSLPGVLPGIGMPVTGGGTLPVPRVPLDSTTIVRGSSPGGFPVGGTGGTKSLTSSGPVGGSPVGMIGSAPGGHNVQRVSPVGGVIGQQAGGQSGGRPGGHAQLGGAAFPPSQHGGHGRGPASREGHQWDPDNPWAVEEGVPPIIAPSTTVERFDPGPGVIGLDR